MMRRGPPTRVVQASPAHHQAARVQQEYPEGHTGFTLEVGELDDSCVMDTGDASVPSGDLIVPTPLPASEADAIFAGVDDIKAAADDEKEFAIRPKTKPPPKTGNIQEHSFPPAGDVAPPAGAASAASELTVLRASPEGAVAVASHVSVTFSLPMVPLGTVDQVAQNEVPVELDPQPAGRWRWVGTQTLLFEPEHRFPCATTYKVVVAKGTQSTSGAALAKSYSFSFSTRALTLTGGSPSGTVPHTPFFSAAFDQKVEAADVLPFLRVRVRSSKQLLEVAPVTEEELDADNAHARMAKSTLKRATAGTAVAFKLAGDAKLAYGEEHEIVLLVNAPSAEGPTRTDTEQSGVRFSAYGTFEFSKTQPHHGAEWEPYESVTLQFTQAIDAATVSDETVRAEPVIPAMRVRVHGSSLVVSGHTVGNTAYELSVAAGAMRDVFGQELAAEANKAIQVGRAQPQLHAFRQGVYVADPMQDRSKLAYPIVAVNHAKVKVSVHRVARKDLHNSTRRVENQLPGEVVYSHEAETGCIDDVPKRLDFSLTEALNGRHLGHALVEVEEIGAKQHPMRFTAWVQSTELGVDVIAGSGATGAYVFVSRLVDGTPVAGAKVALEQAVATAKRGVMKGEVLAEGTTDVHGMCHVEDFKAGAAFTAVAEKDGDWCFCPRRVALQNVRGQGSLLWHVFDDRKMYKPKEEVHIKGWVRVLSSAAFHERTQPASGCTLSYEVRAGRDTIAKGTLETSRFGAFDFAVTLPGEVQLGHARVNPAVGGRQGRRARVCSRPAPPLVSGAGVPHARV
eukprot:TRINITY_DN2391_c0_g1_i9.p1 TRINITY_DN2391_c0_g1~~TRINITY_DN2391_c0_g1_i9.p1  ORF type:complete len:793 (+),score=266.52 TRINITY_DN2391_c0_g1_i9:161-2539(+)